MDIKSILFLLYLLLVYFKGIEDYNNCYEYLGIRNY